MDNKSYKITIWQLHNDFHSSHRQNNKSIVIRSKTTKNYSLIRMTNKNNNNYRIMGLPANAPQPKKTNSFLRLYLNNCPPHCYHTLMLVLKNFCQTQALLTFNLSTKGQLISECLFGVFNFPKKQRKNLMNFCPRI